MSGITSSAYIGRNQHIKSNENKENKKTPKTPNGTITYRLPTTTKTEKQTSRVFKSITDDML